jgi:BolA protein
MSRKKRIYNALSMKLTFDSLEIDDESHGHNVPTGAETHFKVVAVSTEFKNLNRVARHRLINTALADEFSAGLHALSLHLYTPDEWSKKITGVTTSPLCQHRKN